MQDGIDRLSANSTMGLSSKRRVHVRFGDRAVRLHRYRPAGFGHHPTRLRAHAGGRSRRSGEDDLDLSFEPVFLGWRRTWQRK